MNFDMVGKESEGQGGDSVHLIASWVCNEVDQNEWLTADQH